MAHQYFFSGCVPEELRGSTEFVIEQDFIWRYAKRVTFKHVTNNNTGVDPSLQLSRITHSVDDIIKLPDIDQLCKFFKSELEFEDTLLKIGMKVGVEFLSQRYFFIVDDIEPASQELTEEMINTYGFRCYANTKINIIEEVVIDNKCKRTFNDFGGYNDEIKNLKDSIDNYYNGSSSVSGILVSGISGTGKSYLCSILSEIYDNCFSYSSEDIISNYKGEIESNLKKIFQKANKR